MRECNPKLILEWNTIVVQARNGYRYMEIREDGYIVNHHGEKITLHGELLRNQLKSPEWDFRD
jgi:hypothetical protein